MSNHAYRLMERHQQLDAELREVLGHPAVDTRRVARLKKLKLAIKDRLASLMRGPARAR